MKTSVGIVGLGLYLPEEIRRNDWWPTWVTAKWQDKQARRATQSDETTTTTTSEQMIRGMLAKLAHDPFQGSVERRVAPPNMSATDMGLRAAREAIARAGIALEDIDLLLTHAQVADLLNTPDAGLMHHELGLKRECFSMVTEVACNAFQVQLTMAEQMIASGQARYGLLIQVSNLRQLVPSEAPHSAWFGDGATAVIVGPVTTGKGVLGYAYRTRGDLCRALVYNVPGKRWFEEGAIAFYPEDPGASREMLMSTPVWCEEVLEAALAKAAIKREEIDFFASHQATSWMLRCIREYCGLGHTKSIETFPWAGSLGGANISLQLALAERDGILRDGDIVASWGGAMGVTYSATIMRWGV